MCWSSLYDHQAVFLLIKWLNFLLQNKLFRQFFKGGTVDFAFVQVHTNVETGTFMTVDSPTLL